MACAVRDLGVFERFTLHFKNKRGEREKERGKTVSFLTLARFVINNSDQQFCRVEEYQLFFIASMITDKLRRHSLSHKEAC